MSRKHFVMVAAIVALIKDPADRKATADRFVSELTRENPRFDRARFLAACGVES